MIESISHINFLEVLTALVASFIFGGIWFGVIIAKLYVVALGRQEFPAQKPAPIYIFGPVVCNLLVVLTSAVLIQMLKIETVADALAFGALVGIGYVLSTVANLAINPNFPRPFLYTLINAPYFIASSLMTSVIIVVMS